MIKIVACAFGGAIIFIFYPFFSSFTLPLSHDYVRTRHPPSPHHPPSDIHISEDQVSSFHEDGFLVVRNVLNSDLIKTLNSASKDVRINKTLHCEMAYYNGPPIFHKVNKDVSFSFSTFIPVSSLLYVA